MIHHSKNILSAYILVFLKQHNTMSKKLGTSFNNNNNFQPLGGDGGDYDDDAEGEEGLELGRESVEESQGIGEDGDAGLEEEDEIETEAEQPPQQIETRIEKPQLWIRVKGPDNIDNSIYQINESSKTLKLIVRPEDRLFQKKAGKTVCFSFEAEGILPQNSTQDELYDSAIKEVVTNAMDGVSGVVICGGPEGSGKTFSLFGPDTISYQLRGMVERAIEDIFSIVQESKTKEGNPEFHIILSMFEIRKDKIKDLLTLAPTDLTRVGDFGPKGLFFEEVLSVDHAITLILRGLAGQQQLLRENARYHTLVYIDILASSQGTDAWRSRITFAEIASLPAKTTEVTDSTANHQTKTGISLCRSDCADTPTREGCSIHGKCCGGPIGSFAEIISIRKDMTFLEQMFMKTYDLKRVSDYYGQLQKMGMYMLVRPPAFNGSQYFRQSKLAHCLKDIVSGRSLIRLIIHIRPQRSFLQSTLETMRFAEKAKCLPCEISVKKHCVESKLTQMCQDLGITLPTDAEKAQEGNPSCKKLKDMFKLAINHFEEKLDTLEGPCKDQVKTMFETFRDVWSQMMADKEAATASTKEKEDLHDPEDGKQNDEQEHPTDTHTASDSSIRTLKPSTSKKKQDKEEDRKQKKRGLRGSNNTKSKSKVRHGGTSKDGGESARGSNSKKRAIKGSIIAGTPVTDEEEVDEYYEEEHLLANERSPSVTVSVSSTVPNESNERLVSQVNFKRRCWKAFSTKSESGISMLTAFAEHQNILQTNISEHNDILKDVVNSMIKLVNLELNLDQFEEERLLYDEIDEIGNFIHGSKEQALLQKLEIARQSQQELLQDLQNHRSAIKTQLEVLNRSKKECEKAFETFCTEKYGKSPDFANLPLTTMPSTIAAITEEALGFPQIILDNINAENTGQTVADYSAFEKKFEDLNRIAKLEAQMLINKAYPKRPPWTMF